MLLYQILACIIQGSELFFGERKTPIFCYGEWRTDQNLVREQKERSYPEGEREQKKHWKLELKSSKPEISLCFRELFIKLLLQIYFIKIISYKSKHIIAKAFFGALFSVFFFNEVSFIYCFIVLVNFIMLSNQFLFFLIMT